MTWPPSDSPFWKIVNSLLLILVLGMMLAYNYQSGFEPSKDLKTMAMCVCGYIAGEGLRWFLAPK